VAAAAHKAAACLDIVLVVWCRNGAHAVSCSAVQDNFLVTTRGNKKFEEADLSEGEWNEYDDKINESVGIYSLESKWELHKGK
jgi:hypothetical protein